MTYSFKNIIIRKPNKSIQNALSSQNINPVFENILEEHNNYVEVMNELNLKVNLLEPLEDFPEAFK